MKQSLFILLLVLLAVPAEASKVLKASSKFVIISHRLSLPWKKGDDVCLFREYEEIGCGKIAKASKKTAAVRLTDKKSTPKKGDLVKRPSYRSWAAKKRAMMPKPAPPAETAAAPDVKGAVASAGGDTKKDKKKLKKKKKRKKLKKRAKKKGKKKRLSKKAKRRLKLKKLRALRKKKLLALRKKKKAERLAKIKAQKAAEAAKPKPPPELVVPESLLDLDSPTDEALEEEKQIAAAAEEKRLAEEKEQQEAELAKAEKKEKEEAVDEDEEEDPFEQAAAEHLADVEEEEDNEEREVASESTSTVSKKGRFGMNLNVGGNLGLNHVFPMLGLQFTVAKKTAIGVSAFFSSSTSGATKLTATGFYVTGNYYLGKQPFSGAWMQLGFGGTSYGASNAGTSESTFKLGVLATGGYRFRWKSGLNLGVGAGAQIVADPKLSLVAVDFKGFQPTVVVDLSYIF